MMQTLYYRLKIIDKDGKTVVSQIVTLENNEIGKELKVYPNPANDVLTIENSKGKTVEIIDVLGKIILLDKNSTRATINIAHLKSGVYFVKVGQIMQKFIKF